MQEIICNSSLSGVSKVQKVESKEEKPHGITNPSLTEKQEVETAKKLHSKNKNEEVDTPVENPESSKNSSATPVLSPEASKNSSDSDSDDEPWPLDDTFEPGDELYTWDVGYTESDSDDEMSFKRWRKEYEDGYADSDSDDETHKLKEDDED